MLNSYDFLVVTPLNPLVTMLFMLLKKLIFTTANCIITLCHRPPVFAFWGKIFLDVTSLPVLKIESNFVSADGSCEITQCRNNCRNAATADRLGNVGEHCLFIYVQQSAAKRHKYKGNIITDLKGENYVGKQMDARCGPRTFDSLLNRYCLLLVIFQRSDRAGNRDEHIRRRLGFFTRDIFLRNVCCFCRKPC